DANLVSAAGPRENAAKGVAAEALDHLVVATRLLTLLLVIAVNDGHLDAVGGVVADAALDVIAVAVEHALGDGPVLLEHLARLELVTEVAVRLLFLGHQDDAAGVAVQPMHDARPVVAARAAELAEVKLQGVDQRAAPVPLGRV